MSAAATHTRATAAPTRPTPARPLRLRPPRVRHERQTEPDSRRALGSLPFVLLVGGLLAAGLLTLLVVNNSLAAGSFEQARLRADLTLLGEQEQALTQQVQRASSPTQLRAAAKALGMVPAATTTYFDPATGAILGTPLPSGATAGNIVADPGLTEPTTGSDGVTAPDGVTVPDGSDGATAGDPAAERQGDSIPTTPESGAGGDGAQQPSPAPTTAYDRAIVSGGSQ